MALDPRLADWQARAASRTAEAVEALSAVPGVTGLVLGGSTGRGQHWPLSDIDLIAICADRSVEDTARDVDMAAYRMSEMWGTSGIYTAVDAGRLTFDADDVRETAAGDRALTLERIADSKWLHGIDKVYGGVAVHDPHGSAQTFLDWSAAMRFDKDVVAKRIATWFDQADQAITRARQLQADGDEVGAWIALRQLAGALSEIATERWGERSGSLGRHWTHFEARSRRNGNPALADRIIDAIHAQPTPKRADAPEWLNDRIVLSYAARRMVGEDVTPEQNVRDNTLAYAMLYRGRFPKARHAWMRPKEGAHLSTAIDDLTALTRELR